MNDKELLLKDLCARLPYGVKVQTGLRRNYETGETFSGIETMKPIMISIMFENGIEEYKPYLFPLSSMTDEQWREFFEAAGYEVREEDCGRHTEMYYYDMVGHDNTLYPNCDGIDWLNAHHFDYRNLINKNLAIDCTNLNIY